MSEQVVSPIGRVLWGQNVNEVDDNGKYSIKIAFEAEEAREMIEIAEATAKERFGDLKKIGMPFRDGNEQVDSEGKVWSWCEDKTVITFRTKNKPSVIGPGGGNDIIEADEVYNGCYCRVVTDFYAWTYQSKKGVSASLHAVQFYRHGDRIGKKSFDPTNAFGAATETGLVSPIDA